MPLRNYSLTHSLDALPSVCCCCTDGRRLLQLCWVCSLPRHHTTTILRPFFQDHPGEPVPEENFWTLWCKGRLTEADSPTIQLGATPSGLSSALLHHPPLSQNSCSEKSVEQPANPGSPGKCPALGRGTPSPLFSTLVHSPPHLLFFFYFAHFPFLVRFTYFLLSSTPFPFLPE